LTPGGRWVSRRNRKVRKKEAARGKTERNASIPGLVSHLPSSFFPLPLFHQEVMMKLKVSMESTGLGYFPGLAKPTTVDVDALPEKQSEQIKRLVEEASFFDQPRQVEDPTRGLYDAQQVTLTIEEGKRRHTVQMPNPVGDPALQALLDEALAQVREQRTSQRKLDDKESSTTSSGKQRTGGKTRKTDT
jgi:hypothetical protein